VKKNAEQTRQETAIKIDHAKKSLKSFDVCRGREREDGLNSARKGRKAGGSDVVAKTVNFRNGKNTFVGIDPETVVCQQLENLFKMLQILLLRVAENKNVIEVNKNKRTGAKNCIHETLEGLGSIFVSERHEFEFE
jgi:hypothetical protein